MEKTAAIVLAAGRGKRMHSNVAKQYLLLKGKPVLYYALKVFEDSFIDEIVLVAGPGEEEYCQKEIVEKFRFKKIHKIVTGGKERYHSVKNGLDALKNEKIKDVYIHDGARPFVSQSILNRTKEALKDVSACVVGVPVTDTIKSVRDGNYVAGTLERKNLWSIQTPQAFDYNTIYSAYVQLMGEERTAGKNLSVTDDAMVLETVSSKPIRLVMGSYDNIKITTPEDLLKAQIIFEHKKDL